MQRSPGPHTPQSIGVPQPLLALPHCSPCCAQLCAPQQVPSLSDGFRFKHRLLLQTLSTAQVAPPGLPAGPATPTVAHKMIISSEAVVAVFMEPPATEDLSKSEILHPCD